MRSILLSLAAIVALADAALAAENCDLAKLSPEVLAPYRDAEAMFVTGIDASKAAQLTAEIRQLPLTRCERVVVLRLETAALTSAQDYELGLARAIETYELDRQDGTHRARTILPIVVLLQKLGRVSEAERWAAEHALTWPAKSFFTDSGFFDANFPEPATPMQVEYPEAAGGREGYCEVSFGVHLTGRPDMLGIGCSDPVFIDAAQAAVMGLDYSPEAIQALYPRRPRTVVPVVFRPD